MNRQKSSGIEEMEIIISNFLRLGVVLSSVIILIGLSLFLITGSSGYAGSYFPTTLPEIFGGLAALKPYAIILLGLIVLILTPVFRVGVSILVFLKDRDYTFAKITALVFLILIVSFLLGKVE